MSRGRELAAAELQNAASSKKPDLTKKGEMHKQLSIFSDLVNDINHITGKTALMQCAIKNNVECIAYLVVEQKADLEIKDQNGNTALMLAVKNNALQGAQKLIDLKANLACQDINGVCPLLEALQTFKFDIAEALLEADSPLDIEDKKGNSPRRFSPLTSGQAAKKLMGDEDDERMEKIKQKITLKSNIGQSRTLTRYYELKKGATAFIDSLTECRNIHANWKSADGRKSGVHGVQDENQRYQDALNNLIEEYMTLLASEKDHIQKEIYKSHIHDMETLQDTLEFSCTPQYYHNDEHIQIIDKEPTHFPNKHQQEQNDQSIFTFLIGKCKSQKRVLVKIYKSRSEFDNEIRFHRDRSSHAKYSKFVLQWLSAVDSTQALQQSYSVFKLSFVKPISVLLNSNFNGQHLILKNICETVRWLHNEQSIVHGKLLPSNILYVEEEGNLVVKLSGFEFAGVESTAVASLRKRYLEDCVGYWHPETLVRTDDILVLQKAGDIFHLGLIFFQLICGQSTSVLDGKSKDDLLRCYRSTKEFKSLFFDNKYTTMYLPTIFKMCSLQPDARLAVGSILGEITKNDVEELNRRMVAAESESKGLREEVIRRLVRIDNKLTDVTRAIEEGFDDLPSKMIAANPNNSASLEKVLTVIKEVQAKIESSNNEGQNSQNALEDKMNEFDRMLKVISENNSNSNAVVEGIKAIQENVGKLRHEIKEDSDEQKQAVMDYIANTTKSMNENISFLFEGMKKVEERTAKVLDVMELKSVDQVLAKLESVQNSILKDNRERSKESRLKFEEIKDLTKTALDKETDQSSVVLLTSMHTMLETLLLGSYGVPTIAVIVPYKPTSKDSSWKLWKGMKAAGHRIMSIFQEEWRLFFVCSYTLQIVPCGPDGQGYKVTKAKEWVKKAAPILQVGLTLAKIGLMAAGLPIPIPYLMDLVKDKSTSSFVEISLDALDLAGEFLTECAHSDASAKSHETPAGPGNSTNSSNIMNSNKYPEDQQNSNTDSSKHPVGNNVDGITETMITQLQSVNENNRTSYEAVKALLIQQDPTLAHLGVIQKVHAHTGTSAWIYNDPEVIDLYQRQDYKDEGVVHTARMAAGRNILVKLKEDKKGDK